VRATKRRSTPAATSRTRVGGSRRKPLPGARRVGGVAADETVEVTVLVRPRAPLPSAEELGSTPLGERRYLTRREFAARYGAERKDLAAIADFATEHGLHVRQASAARRSVVLTGPAERMEAAFRTRLARYRSPEGDYRGRSGHLHVPARVAPAIEAVLGLDDRPQATTASHAVPHERVEEARLTSFTPTRVAELYDFPGHLDGSGQRIGVIELGGGFRRSRLRRYFEKLGRPMPKITAVSVDGVRNRPGIDHAADGEVVLDVEVIGAIAPRAEQLVYFAPTSDRGFVDAVTTALFDPRAPSILSISWGQAEEQWTEQGRRALDQAFQAAAALGVTVLAASGDNGWRDGVEGQVAHVDFPASSPYVLACGGTRLEVTERGEIVEVVWNDHDGTATGGGVSAFYEVPPWQARVRVPPSVNDTGAVGRGVPDVAGNADPDTGYLIGDGLSEHPFGGTSAVAPLWAALVAQLNQHLGAPAGFLNPLLYERVDPTVFNDVPTGGNGAYRARRRAWDACTGHGTPRGRALLEALSG
jgi:kumamolisin